MRNLLFFLATWVICSNAYSLALFGTVDALSGSANVEDRSGKSAAVTLGLKIFEGQTITSGPEGEVHLVTEDGGIIALRPNTVFRVDEYKAEGNSSDRIFMSLLKGAVRSITGWVGKYNNSAYRITTPTATIGIRGTDHETTVIENGNGDEPGTYDNVNEGATVLKTPQGVAEVTPGKFAFAPKGGVVAPVFLAQRPRFLAMRRLKIEERIQSRKEYMRSRLENMREERLKTQANRIEQRGISNNREQGATMGRRNDLHQHQFERDRQQVRGMKSERSLRDNGRSNTARTERRKEMVREKKVGEERQRRYPERIRREKMKRE
ncbi:FecR protein [mine drainage metagenome]|uniref:FecR protein n=1 Tax=mine drainage metagenome TaxID=410659 RepID=A0A1J5T6N6_9ZZZZ